MKKTFWSLLAVLFLSSCASSKKTVYFQGIDQADLARAVSEYEVRIMPNDNLHITVSAINPEAVEIFNNLNITTSVNADALNIMGYLVDNDGFINFPVLGKVHLEGKTKTEAVDCMTGLISEYIENPVVNIRFINYKVTVLGEVNKPGTYTIKDEKITLLEALGMAGDLTIYGKRDNVIVVREVDGISTHQRIDLTSPEVFTSDFFFLRQNDLVYVQPNKARSGSSSYNQNLTLGVSVFSLIITIVALVVK